MLGGPNIRGTTVGDAAERLPLRGGGGGGGGGDICGDALMLLLWLVVQLLPGELPLPLYGIVDVGSH